MDSYSLLLLVRQTASFSSDDIARGSCPISDWMKSQRLWDGCPPVPLGNPVGVPLQVVVVGEADSLILLGLHCQDFLLNQQLDEEPETLG